MVLITDLKRDDPRQCFLVGGVHKGSFYVYLMQARAEKYGEENPF
jgi:hypothetical protein